MNLENPDSDFSTMEKLMDEKENMELMSVEEAAAYLAHKQSELSFKITGILLDTNIGARDFRLKPFCQTIYRTSEVFRDDIMQTLVNQRV